MARVHALMRLGVRPVCSQQHFVARRAASSEAKAWRVLGIETSADDTCVAVMDLRLDEQQREMGRVRELKKVTYDNKKHGGIHPVEAVESHTRFLSRLVYQSTWLKGKPDLICVTRGPGMGGCLSVGVSTAKALSAAWGVPIVGVHHMQAHALTCAMEHAIGSSNYDGGDISYPFLTLLVSGKHTMLVHTKSSVDHRILARSENVALGDVLDKIARELVPSSVIESQPDDQPICYPRLLEEMTSELFGSYVAAKSRKDEIKTYKSEYGWTLQPPLQGTRAMKYEFNGLGSQTRNPLRANPEMTEAERQVLGTEFMRLAFEHLVSRVILALETDEDLLRDPPKHLILSGGVASNMFLRTIIKETLEARGYKRIKLCVPSREYCTDNAAMIAYAGWKMFLDGWTTELEFCPAVKWSIEEIITGADCWERRSGFPPMTPEDVQRESTGPAVVTEDLLKMAQDPLSSDTKQEDGFPGQSLFFPGQLARSVCVPDSRILAELREQGLKKGYPSLNISENAVNSSKPKASEKAVERGESPSNSQEVAASNKLAEVTEKKPTAAELSSNTLKDIVLGKALEATSEDVKAPRPSSHRSKKTANAKSPVSSEPKIDEVNVKLKLLMNQADSILDTLNSDSRSRDHSAAENSQAASEAAKMRTPTAQTTASAKSNSDKNHIAKVEQQKEQQQLPATNKADAKKSTTDPVSSSEHTPTPPRASRSARRRRRRHRRNSILQSLPAATQPATEGEKKKEEKEEEASAETWNPPSSDLSRHDPLDPFVASGLSKSARRRLRGPMRRPAHTIKEWVPMPAPNERHTLKVHRLGFADDSALPSSQKAPTFMSRMASMFGLGSK